ncbi:MAG TPA: D-alanine--D-alanine ligase [Polyangia bacterium]|nr:D-alanine--D-alanine ligase [Polyangia bacterium]
MTGHRKIGVLLGGLSGERDVSIRSGEAIVAALVERGHDAVPVFVDRDIDLVLRQMRIDVAFLALHGRYGEDGCIQGLLEVLGIPYTGSGVLASALAMNKAKTKEILRLHNLPTAPGYVIAADSGEDLIESHGSFGFPVVVKPSGEGSSLGVTVARDEMELESAVEEAIRFDDDVLVERFVEGKEISVGVLDGKVLGAVEIVPRRGFYDFQNKYTAGRSDYYFPARLSPERYRSVLRLGTLAFEALGCEGAARVDLIVSERGNEIILEVNTLPGMTPTSLMPKIAHGAGLSFEDLVEEVLKGARLRAHGHRRDRRAVQVELQGPERRAGFLPDSH